MRYVKTILIVFIALVVLVGIAGYFILPHVVKPILIEKLSQKLHRETAIDKIAINPFLLSVTLNGFTLKEPAQSSPFLSFDELHVDVQGFASLVKKAIIVKEIRLVRPYISIARHEDGSYNFSDMIPKEEKKPEEKPLDFSFNNIQIINGSIDFDDRPMKTRHTVRDMNLSVPFISNIEHYVDSYVEPRFSATVNGDPYELTGKTKPFLTSRETSFEVNIRDLDIPYYLNYVPVKLNCNLISAKLDTKVNINFVVHKDKSPSLIIAGDVAFNKVALDDKQNNKIFRLPALNISLASVEPLIPDIHISRVFMKEPELIVKRSKAGDLNLLNLISQEKPKKPAKEKEEVHAKKEQKGSALKAQLDELTIESANVTFVDSSPAETANIHIAPVNFKMVNFSMEKGSPAGIDLSCTVGNKGQISVKGPLSIDPIGAELAIDVKNLNIRTFQPYFTDMVKINVNSGAVSTSGNFALEQNNKGKSRIKYAGKIFVSNVATVDKAYFNDFVTWKQLFFDRVNAGTNPFFVNINGISLTDFYARIMINPDGTLNIQNIFGGNAEEGQKNAGDKSAPVKPVEGAVEAKPEQSGEMPRNVKIGKVTLQGGTIDFTDRFIKPNYSAKMLNIAGSITGLSAEEISRATVDLRGNLGYGSPIEISGQINPLIKDLFADVKLSFKDIELSPVSPYSSKYVGHPIQKGKLTFDVAYLIDKRKLDAQNKVLIDQLTFGERVESPDAIKAPVTLAVSLLTDRKGQINLDIPVSGSLDDPQFKVWPIIWKVIVNLITKAVTAPFTLIASLIGGGEEMSYIEFDYGSALVTPAGQQKIQSLAKALYERPNIKMDIEGYVDVENDREGLKREALNRKMKVQKLNTMISKGEPAIAVEQVQILPQEYEKYLTLAYKAETFPKPRNVIGIAKSLPPQEMEKLIITHVEVNNVDLLQLAARRADNVKELILKVDANLASRVFVVESPSLSPKKKESVKDSRIDFKLK
jgi:hypothetical protein